MHRLRRSLVAPVLGVTAVTAVLFMGTRALAQTSDGSSPEWARRTYLSDCAVCHGADATGSTRGPSLTGVGRASIDFMVTTGRMPLSEPDQRMARRTPRYDADQQRALVDFVTTLSVAAPSGAGPDVPTLDLAGANVARGGELFRAQCAACHAWSGGGGALLDRESPGVAAATPTQIAEAIRTGPGAMPVFGTAALDDRQLNDTVAFVDSLKHTDDRGGLALGHVGPVSEGAIAIVGALGLLLIGARWIGTSR